MEIRLSIEERARLSEVLTEAQRIGMLGGAPIDQTIERSLGFVQCLPDDVRSVLDLGSGGGDPGLVIAACCPSVEITLVDRRQKRTDFLLRMLGRLELTDRVEVMTGDIAEIPERWPGRRWDAVTSRGLGTPQYTARLAGPLLRPGGCLLVSEPPQSAGERWKTAEIETYGLQLDSVRFGIAQLIKNARRQV